MPKELERRIIYHEKNTQSMHVLYAKGYITN